MAAKKKKVSKKKGANKGRNPAIKPPGRKSEFSDQTMKTICKAIKDGKYIETAAAIAVIQKQTIYNWLREGACLKKATEKDFEISPDKEIFILFLDAVKKGQAEAEQKGIKLLRKAANAGWWQAEAWRLERMFPKKFGRRDPGLVDPFVVAEMVSSIISCIYKIITNAKQSKKLAAQIEKIYMEAKNDT